MPAGDGSGSETQLASLLRLACAMSHFPLGAIYRFEGARARRVTSFGETKVVMPEEAPAWRAQRDEIGLVRMVGRGPAAPESAIFPAEMRVSSLVSAPIRRGPEQIGTLLLGDSVPRDDVDTIDLPSLRFLCQRVAELLHQQVRHRPTPAAGLTLPPRLAEAARGGTPDPVTGLPDRRMLLGPITRMLGDARRAESHVALAIVALDRFNRINDWLGREVGDDLLCQVAERLLEITGPDDLVGRGSGDEFYVVLTGRAEDYRAIAHRIAHAIREPFHVQGYELTLSASLGVARFPHDAGEVATLLRYAEIALHRAKSARTRGRVETFTDELREAVEQRGDTERNLRRALGSGELILYYQPKVDIPSRRPRGVEALIRWQRNGTIVSPGRFLPVAEDSGLIVPMGTWVLLEAARQMNRWVADGLPIESVSVNVSTLQFARPDFVESVERVLDATGLHPGHLELEVTETSLMDDVDLAVQTLSRLRGLGIRISVDDFGTGYSSLAYLQRLPVDVLKIDRAFVMGLDHTEPTQRGQAFALAEAINALGHSLGLRVLAEGVETEGQLSVLEQLGCDEVQGYLFARPLPAEEVPGFIQA